MKALILFLSLITILSSCSTSSTQEKKSAEEIASDSLPLKILKMDTSVFSTVTGRYHHNSDGMIRVSRTDGRLFLKYLRGTEHFELFRISDSTYISRDTAHGKHPIQFKINPADGKLNLVFIEDNKPPVFEHAQESENIQVPYEMLLTGDYDKALKGYKALLKENPNDVAVSEENLNKQGHNLIASGKIQLAKDVLKINIALHPDNQVAKSKLEDLKD